MIVYTITNQKGGVGKTTTAHILASGLVKAGYKVLVIDTDPQTNLTYTAGIDTNNTQDLYDLFINDFSLQAIQKTSVGFDMIAGSVNFARADKEFTDTGREYILRDLLEPVKENYDYCIIDTPPTLGILTINALTASNSVIVPMGADIYSLQGLSQLQGLINNVKKYCNPALQLEGLLLTKYNPRAIINRDIKDNLEQVAKNLNTKVFDVYIREAVAVKEVQAMKQSIFEIYPNSNVTKDYTKFIKLLTGKEV